MKGKMLSLLAGAAMLGSVGVASAAEPTTLSDEQLDTVAAGSAIVIGGLQANSVLTSLANAPINAPVANGAINAAGNQFVF